MRMHCDVHINMNLYFLDISTFCYSKVFTNVEDKLLIPYGLMIGVCKNGCIFVI